MIICILLYSIRESCAVSVAADRLAPLLSSLTLSLLILPQSHTHIWTCKEWRWFFYSLCGTSDLFVSELLLIFLICLRCFCESQFGEWFYSWTWASCEHARNNEAKNCSSSNGHMRLILKASQCILTVRVKAGPESPVLCRTANLGFDLVPSKYQASTTDSYTLNL